MKTILKLAVSLVIFCFISAPVMGQNLTVENTYLTLHIPDDLQTTIDLEGNTNPAEQLQSMSLDYVLSVVVSDPDQISGIQVTVKEEEEGAEIVSHLFAYDDETPGSGMTYFRKEQSILLGLGNYPYHGTVYYEVYLVDLNGDHSPVFIKNTL